MISSTGVEHILEQRVISRDRNTMSVDTSHVIEDCQVVAGLSQRCKMVGIKLLIAFIRSPPNALLSNVGWRMQIDLPMR